MADNEPILCKMILGALRPVNGAAFKAINSIPPDSMVRIEIKKTQGNTKRMAFYWIALKVALDNLTDAFDGPMTTQMLHHWLKREAGLAKPIRSHKTGDILDYDYDSISFHNMPENERAAFIDFAMAKLSARLGCEVSDLIDQANSNA